MSTTRISKVVIGSLSFALLIAAMLTSAPPALAQVAVGVSVAFGPPDLPVYDQPVCPGDDYIWVPGYWSWDGDDYYWVPGTWVLAPEPGLLWTPGYWGWGGSGFIFTAGYWGPVVGFYGGINYGFGYFGTGYEGGRWQGGHFFYNRTVNNVNVTVIHNTYSTRIENVTVNRVSYNGGNGGIAARATAEQEAAEREKRSGAIAAQTQNAEAARGNQQFRASVNHGKPPVAATARPGEFSGGGVVAAREGGTVHTAPASGNRPENNANPGNKNNGNAASRPNPIHPNDYPAAERPAAPNTGNPKLDQKYQQQQDKLFNQQQKQRQQLQQKQDQEHQKMAQQHANDAKQQQVEQRHQQQTQQLMQKHAQQTQSLQQRQQPAHAAPPPRAPEPEKH